MLQIVCIWKENLLNLFVLFCSGSLMTRDLYDVVKAEDFVLNSEYITTLLVVVPK